MTRLNRSERRRQLRAAVKRTERKLRAEGAPREVARKAAQEAGQVLGQVMRAAR